MARARNSASCPLLLLISLLVINFCNGNPDDDQKVYIVYMGGLPEGGDFSAAEQHRSILHTSLGSDRAAESWLYSYTRSFNGFVAKLTEEERHRISSLKEVASVFPNTKYKLHTTRSWDFAGFPINVHRNQTESNIIIGVIDSGIWPESQSFQDAGFGPPPTKWKGTCQSSSNFTCNKKVIGARYYRADGNITEADIRSPRDTYGHGSHTASTAAGGLVPGANFFGLREGTARGGVPSARIAVYKACWSDGCHGADVLAAFDDAIADGVDILSASLADRDFHDDYTDDAISVGAFHAMTNGILTSASAGNGGPLFRTTDNNAPWLLTVGATTIDRKFVSKVHLGNNKTYEGVSVNTLSLKEENYPLVYGGNVPNTALNFNETQSKYCEADSLDPKKVKGSIVLCYSKDGLADAKAAAAAGAAGVIFCNTGFRDYAFTYPIPASVLGQDDGDQVMEYINRTSNPRATIFKCTEDSETPIPFVASFSSRGPNFITNKILKPDLTAPGVDILAAWPEDTTVTGAPEDTRVVPYNILSGTSMACPHATAAAAYVKSFHPTWSPAAIKSALMTTATRVKSLPNDSNFAVFASGSGNINPVKAVSPGLVYDLGEIDYVKFLCGQGYNDTRLQQITGDRTNCRGAGKAISVYDLNYPAFVAEGVGNSTSVRGVFRRTVTNVGSPSSTYKAVVTAQPMLHIRVRPHKLSFKRVGEKRNFVVTVKATVNGTDLAGSLVWDDGVHKVRSPVVAF